MRAHQIMTRSVITIAPDVTILEAANTMLRHHVSGLPVIDAAGQLVGIVSEGDFIRRNEIGTQRKRGRWLKVLLGDSAVDYVRERGRRVSDVMASDPITVTEDATLEEIVNVMETNDIKRLPVMTRECSIRACSRSARMMSSRAMEVYRANVMTKIQAGNLSELVRFASAICLSGNPRHGSHLQVA
ncbi:hypothetical protein CQ10_29065 [Bradyrhizobium valentinum]|uniref:CBS domain-containing protein n=1 Tax=Bradyrhizobium valentinum TaxID=1518501 RepID=A0A0R3KPC0_9BRAD|nr:hypothetical protein CQ10_29065 [Bradyrhizobium valentinum]KRR04307.1 hypothetical protein CP49_36430 [Bradyrhizobium valentinum]